MVNVSRLEENVAWAEAEDAKPEEQSCWYQSAYVVEGETIGRMCQSAFCLAGRVYAQDHTPEEIATVDWYEMHLYAATTLGLDTYQADQLFASQNGIKTIRRLADRFIKEAGDAPVPAATAG